MPQPVLTAAAMREADRQTIEDLAIPGLTLMETAGRESVASIVREFGLEHLRQVVIFCGRGNNGGDGFVVARVLSAHGVRVQVITIADRGAYSGDADANLSFLERIRDEDPTSGIEIGYVQDIDVSVLVSAADLVVDALLGTGLSSELRDPIRSLVEAINRAECPVVSIDVPTGIDSDRGQVMGVAVDADLTVTMGALKAGLAIGEGPEYAGKVDVVDIGIPPHILRRQAGEPGCARVATDADVRGWLPVRSRESHKYSVGMTLAVVGSRQYPGAGFLACKAAARSGSGYVVCATPEDVREVFLCQLDDIPAMGLDQTEDGGLALSALESIVSRLEKANALLVGCGLGRNTETMALVRDLIATSTVPGVLDADGLHALRGFTELIATAPASPWILTPHWGEFLAIAGNDTADAADRMRIVPDYAHRWNCILVLKGLPSVVASPDGSVWIAGTGGPALATAGSGDVLAGLTAGLLSQGMAPEHAAVAALHIGGRVADSYSLNSSGRSMMAGDMVDLIPQTLREHFEKE